MLHQSLDRADGRKPALGQPGFNAGDEGSQMFGAMAKQRRGGHDRVGARQQIFEHLIGRLHARAGGEARARQTAAQQRSPEQTQTDFDGAAQGDLVAPAQASEIDIRLIEAVEQNQSVGARRVETLRQARRRRRKWAAI